MYDLLIRVEASEGGRLPSDSPPLRHCPPSLELNFSMNGQATILTQYIDEASPSAYRAFSRKEINRLIALASLRFENYYGKTDRFLYDAIAAVGGLRGRSVAIFGSLVPWYEAICVASGASKCFTIEYNRLS
jgi:hypothetical protein